MSSLDLISSMVWGLILGIVLTVAQGCLEPVVQRLKTRFSTGESYQVLPVSTQRNQGHAIAAPVFWSQFKIDHSMRLLQNLLDHLAKCACAPAVNDFQLISPLKQSLIQKTLHTAPGFFDSLTAEIQNKAACAPRPVLDLVDSCRRL